MPNTSLQHDVAWACCIGIIEMFEDVLRPEERKNAFGEIYERIKAGLEAYEVQVSRQQQRMNPSRN